MGVFWMNMWLVPVTSSLGWLSLVLVDWDGVADLQRHPSTISSPVLQLSKTVSASVIAVGWHLLQHTNMTKKTQAWALVPHFILAFLQPCKFLRYSSKPHIWAVATWRCFHVLLKSQEQKRSKEKCHIQQQLQRQERNYPVWNLGMMSEPLHKLTRPSVLCFRQAMPPEAGKSPQYVPPQGVINLSYWGGGSRGSVHLQFRDLLIPFSAGKYCVFCIKTIFHAIWTEVSKRKRRISHRAALRAVGSPSWPRHQRAHCRKAIPTLVTSLLLNGFKDCS